MRMKKSLATLQSLRVPLMRWIAFFIGCVLLVVAIMAALSSSMIGGIVERVYVAQQDKMESVRAGIDFHLVDTLNAACQMINDRNLQILSNRTRPYTPYQTSLLYTLNQRLRLFITSHSWDNVALYFSVGDYAQEGPYARPLEEIHRAWDYAMSYDEWRNALQTLERSTFFGIQTKSGGSRAELWCPLSFSVNGENHGVIIIRLALTTLETLLDSMRSYPDELLTIRDAEGNVLCSSSDEPSSADTEWRTTAICSGVCDWTYESAIDEAFLAQPSNQYRQMAFIVCGVLLLAGVVASVVLGVRSYKPIGRLYEVAAQRSGEACPSAPSTSREAYEIIERSYCLMRSNYDSATSKLQRQQRYVRNHLLQRLLSRAWSGESLYASPIYEENGIVFSSDRFRVLLVECLNADDLYDTESYSDADKLSQYLINDMFEDKLSKDYEAMFLMYEGHSVGIIAIPEDQTEQQASKRIAQMCTELSASIQREYALKLCCILSGSYPSLAGVSECYNEVVERNEVRQLTDATERNFIDGSEMRHYQPLPTRFNCSIEMQMRLIQYVKDDNYEDARRLVNEVLDSETLNSGSADVMRLAMFSLINALLNAVLEVSASYDDNLIAQFNVTQRLLNCTSIGALNRETLALFTEIESYVKHNGRIGRKANLVENVKSMVAQRYADPNLSVSVIAEEMKLPISTLSRMFKTKEGCGLLEYINRMRVEVVARLLSHTDMNLSQVAEKTGFINVNTMIRIFKRYVGVTPGKYAQNQANRKEDSPT